MTESAEELERQASIVKLKEQSRKEPVSAFHIMQLLVFSFVIVLPVLGRVLGTNKSNGTDGVFESATKKIDEGHINELTVREKERLNDIIYWCDICKEPLHDCKHGRR